MNSEIKNIFSKKLVTARDSDTLAEADELMEIYKIRHLPVVDGDTVLGMISIRDIMDDIIADHELTINHLQHYISGERQEVDPPTAGGTGS